MDPEDWPLPYNVHGPARQYTMEGLCQVCTDVNTLWHFRKLSGSAFDPTQAKRLRLYGYQNLGPQGFIALKNLALKPGDSMSVIRNFRYDHHSTLTVEKVETNAVLAEENLQCNPTHAKFLKKFVMHQRPTQYD
jgi:hypothetical protein